MIRPCDSAKEHCKDTVENCEHTVENQKHRASGWTNESSGARTRPADLGIMIPALYQLSYAAMRAGSLANVEGRIHRAFGGFPADLAHPETRGGHGSLRVGSFAP